MIKKILTYSFGEVLVKGASFLAVPLYSYMILPGEYGTLGFLNSLVSFLPFVFTFYYLYGYVRFAVEVKEDILITNYLLIGLFLNLFYMMSSIVLYRVWIRDYQIDFEYFLLSISASSSVFVFQILQMYYRSKGDARSYIKLSMAYAILGLILNFLLLILFKDNVFAMLLSALITALIVSTIALLVLKNFFSWELIDFGLMKQILQYTMPLVPGAIALLLFSQSDKLVLINYVDRQTLGIYTVAFTMGLSMSYIGSAIFMGYQPIFYEKVSNGFTQEIEKQFNKNIFLVISALFLSWVAIVVIYQFIDEKYKEGIIFALAISLAYCMMTFSQIMELHLTYIKKNSIVSFVYGSGGVLTVGMLLLLVPKYSGVGASSALVISSCFISVMMYFFAQKYFYLHYDKRGLVLFYGVILLMSGLLYVCL